VDYYEFNRRALAALNRYPQKDRLAILRKTADYTKRYGYQASVEHLLPALERGGKCQDAGELTPDSGRIATLF